MPTTYPSQKSDKFLLRLPSGVREQVAIAAIANNRTMTKEMVLRLEKSFDPTSAGLPDAIQPAVAAELAARGGTAGEALTRLVLAGQSKNATVVALQVAPGTTAQQLYDALAICIKAVPPDAMVVV
jgi:hypothetical protein